jgi:ankyrin repeat protein
VDVNERDNELETPLGVASKNGKLEVVKVLAKGGANVNSRNKYGWTSLHRASMEGHLDVVRSLLDDGADVNAKYYKFEGYWSALHVPAASGAAWRTGSCQQLGKVHKINVCGKTWWLG